MIQTNTMPPTHRHKWDHHHEIYIAPDTSRDGNERVEKVCMLCRMTKITVIPPRGQAFPWHEWRLPSGDVWIGEATPPCIENATHIGEAREAAA